MNWIEHIIRPDKLLLTWQSPNIENRTRRVVAELIRNGKSDARLIYLTGSEDFDAAKESNFAGFPAFRMDKVSHDNALGIFVKRIPPRTRGDYSEYLKAIRIKAEDMDMVDDFTLLGYSGAKLPDDDFAFVHPFDNARGKFELQAEVCGFRYISDRDSVRLQIREGQVVTLQKETENAFDKNAVRIMVNDIKLGYINRVLLPVFNQWLDDKAIKEVVIERINGTKTSPKLYLFVRVDWNTI